MRYKEYFLLKESQSVLYHYTNNLGSILASNTFELSNALLTSENRFLPKGNKKPYYMSFSRNRTGEYKGDTLLVIDGDKLSHRYQLIPTNYWGSRMGYGNEMEDRLWSSEPFIKNAISYIKEIHLYVPEERLSDKSNPFLPSSLQFLKIPVYIYTNRKDLFLMNTKNAISIKNWDDFATKYFHRGNEYKDLELVEFLETGNPKGKKRFMEYKYYPIDFVNGISTDLHNMRSNRTGVNSIFYRDLDRRLTNLFRKYNANDTKTLLKKMYNSFYKKDYFQV